MTRRRTQLAAATLLELGMAEPAPPSEPPPPPPPELPLAVREVLGFPAALLPALPLPTCLLCTLVHTNERVLLAAQGEALVAGEVAFVGAELLALVAAIENERSGPDSLSQWWARKLKEPTWRLTSIGALGGVARRAPLGWTVAQVLRAYGVRLDEVRA